MLSRSTLSLAAAFCFATMAPHALSAQSGEAQAAAERWLALVDADDYVQSWEAAASSFKAAITAEAWAEQATQVRAQVGSATERTLADTQVLTDPPGAPPGEYMQLQYNTAFASAGQLSENVILVRDGERGWRVAGYFIRPPG